MPIEVLLEDGKTIFKSPAWERANVNEAAFSFPLSSNRQTFSFRTQSGERYRLMQGSAELENSKVWLRAALSEERIWKEIGELILVFIILFPVAIGVAGFAGYWMASKALKPIQKISNRQKI
jgi:hypothetical protein